MCCYFVLLFVIFRYFLYLCVTFFFNMISLWNQKKETNARTASLIEQWTTF